MGRAGKDLLNGGVGNDILKGGAGIDTLVGGKGDETYIVHGTKDTIREFSNGGINIVYNSPSEGGDTIVGFAPGEEDGGVIVLPALEEVFNPVRSLAANLYQVPQHRIEVIALSTTALRICSLMLMVWVAHVRCS